MNYNMKDLQEYINEEKKTTGAGCVEMVIGRHNFSLEQVQKFIKDEL